MQLKLGEEELESGQTGETVEWIARGLKIRENQ